jgi:hypothetical protein
MDVRSAALVGFLVMAAQAVAQAVRAGSRDPAHVE